MCGTFTEISEASIPDYVKNHALKYDHFTVQDRLIVFIYHASILLKVELYILIVNTNFISAKADVMCTGNCQE